MVGFNYYSCTLLGFSIFILKVLSSIRRRGIEIFLTTLLTVLRNKIYSYSVLTELFFKLIIRKNYLHLLCNWYSLMRQVLLMLYLDKCDDFSIKN